MASDLRSETRVARVTRENLEINPWAAATVPPQLRALHVLRTWAAMNIDIDGAPILGEVPGRKGFFNAVTAAGYTLAPAVARLTSQLVDRGSCELDVIRLLY